mgnify:CR=1 FL=1
MGLLDGDLAEAIFQGFKGKLLTGVIRQKAVPESGGLDDLGDAIDATPTDTPLEGFVDEYDAAFKARAGIPQTDVKVCIFAQSIPGVRPGRDDKARIDRSGSSQWYQIRRVMTDPALALWECQSFEIQDPDA